MSTLSAEKITKFLLNGTKKLLDEARETVKNASSYTDARINQSVIDSAIQNYKTHENNEYSSCTKGLIAGAAVGFVGSLTPFAPAVATSFFGHAFSYTAGLSVLGGVGGMSIDTCKRETTGVRIQENIKALIELQLLARDKASTFAVTEEKEISAGFRHHKP